MTCSSHLLIHSKVSFSKTSALNSLFPKTSVIIVLAHSRDLILLIFGWMKPEPSFFLSHLLFLVDKFLFFTLVTMNANLSVKYLNEEIMKQVKHAYVHLYVGGFVLVS